jgi:DNA polymerase
MPDEAIMNELVSLIRDTREQLTYLHELGVTNLEATSSGVGPNNSGAAIPQTRARVLADSDGPAPAPPSSSIKSTVSIPTNAPPASISPDTLFGDLSVPAPVLEKSSETLVEIWADVGNCNGFPLYEGRTNIVHTEGNRHARLMFVGEAPGADEDAQARPFVGRAGQLLTKIIEAIGLKREEVLIGNVNRCRPPGNRPPTEEEASICKPFLLREIAAVQPEVIVVLGNTATHNLLETKQGITRLRGQFHNYQGVKVMPTFHPAYLLRDPSKKKETWEDLKKVRDYLDTTPRPKS